VVGPDAVAAEVVDGGLPDLVLGELRDEVAVEAVLRERGGDVGLAAAVVASKDWAWTKRVKPGVESRSMISPKVTTFIEGEGCGARGGGLPPVAKGVQGERRGQASAILDGGAERAGVGREGRPIAIGDGPLVEERAPDADGDGPRAEPLARVVEGDARRWA
jgi:hypothetical protein